MKFIYNFSEGNRRDTSLLGGKGSNLCEMYQMGLPVPDGFVISTEACNAFLNNEPNIWENIEKQVKENIRALELKTNKFFSGNGLPLLVSVRSGSKFSMPGMMDTILNLGLNDKNTENLKQVTQNGKFAYDCYRRLIEMFAEVVYKVDKDIFDQKIEFYKKQNNKTNFLDLPENVLKELINEYKMLFSKHVGKEFPQDPYIQIFEAIKAVFKSWNNNRAYYYRKINGIPHTLGTAVNIQEMVFGNLNENSGSGVAFTRNPSTGDKGVFGEILFDSQGEDVVAGTRTPESLEVLKTKMPHIYEEFIDICKTLETHYKDMQDIEFTIENGKLYILQTRVGKRTASASIKILFSLLEEGIINQKETILKLNANSIENLIHPEFDKKSLSKSDQLTNGLPACPGAATGKIYFSSKDALVKHNSGEKVILVRKETSPEDIEGMTVSQAIITATGGMTSHAAVVARGMGVCCVVGCNNISIDYKTKSMDINGHILNEGDVISVDGSSGNIYTGEISISKDNNYDLLNKLFDLMEEVKNKYNVNTLQVRSNADTPKDIQNSLDLGADGIGLVRTEHMFFNKERITKFRQLFLSNNEESFANNLTELKKYQKQDFYEIFKILVDKPCTIRLLDPPLNEFLPKNDEEFYDLAKLINVDVEQLKSSAVLLEEANPMLGHRGCRLGITLPQIYIMQCKAIIEAAIKISEEMPEYKIIPNIMIPLITIDKELILLRNLLTSEIDNYFQKIGKSIEYKIGTMLETPRSCLIADKLAEFSDFFSFGTNDLTQLSYGFSRDDSHKFLDHYSRNNIIENDPFQVIDKIGVGKLMEIAIQKARKIKNDITFGVCGEIAGHTDSIMFLDEINVDYVSCSPFRIPSAKIASLQSALKKL